MAAENVPERFFFPNPLEYVTQEEARDPKGALKYFVETGNAAIDEDGKATWKKRRTHCFMQFFSIQVVKPNSGKENTYDGKEEDEDLNLEQIYGRINVSYSDDIFDRQIGKCSPHDIDPDGFIRLSGPASPLCVNCSYVVVYPKMYRGNQPKDFFHPASGKSKNGHPVVPGEKIPFLDSLGAKGKYLSCPDMSGLQYNKIIIEKMPTACGTLKMAYAIFTKAVECYLTVKLLEWNREGSCANFYGKIFVKNTRLKHDHRANRLVFVRDRDEDDLYVESHKCLSLLRPSNVASIGYALMVNVNIMHKTGVSLSKEHDLAIKGRLSFSAKCPAGGNVENGIFESKVIRGEWGALEVKVYWLPSWSH